MQARTRAAWSSAFFWVVAALALAVVLGAALAGALANVLFVLPWLLAVVLIVSRLVGAMRRSLETGFVRQLLPR